MDKKELEKNILEAAEFLRNAGVDSPETGIVLGTGLNDYADRIEDPVIVRYSDIPGFVTGKVSGHRGQLIYGKHMGRRVVIMAGRFHYYESQDMDKTTLPVRVMIELGIKRLIITNAAGCINRDFRVGQLMLISDHINFSGDNPLKGDNLDKYGPRFPDMTYVYNKELREKLKERAAEKGIDLAEGVYMMFSGPSFETPAEIRFAGTIGADAAGMSTVPEAIVANQAGLEIIGITFLSNMAAGVLDQPLSGEEVDANSVKVRKIFPQVVDMAIELV